LHIKEDRTKMEKKVSIIVFSLWAVIISSTNAKHHLHQNKFDYGIIPYNKYLELLKGESNIIDHGPQYPVKPKDNHQWIKAQTKPIYLNSLKNKKIATSLYGKDIGSQIGNLDWIANTLHDNDDYKLQDLSLGIDSGMQDDGGSKSIFVPQNVQKKKQAQWKNSNRSLNKKGKKAHALDEEKQLLKTSYINNSKIKNASMSANNTRIKKRNYYYNKQKYKYENQKKTKSKQKYYGWMKYMKP